MSSRLQPAILGGVFIGVLSALPVVNIGNCCCCLWVVGGGALAAYLLQQSRATPITTGDGAVVGVLAGVVGAVVHTILNIPISLMFGPMQADLMQRLRSTGGQVPPEVQQFLDQMQGGGSTVFILIGFCYMLVVGVIFGALGGLLGALFFRKDLPPPPPPMSSPTGFGGPFEPPPYSAPRPPLPPEGA
jgi:hypothetical protein